MRIALVLLPGWRRETPSLAIAYLSAMLEKYGHTVSRFEFNLEKRYADLDESLLLKKADEFADRIIECQPDICGFSVYVCNKEISDKVAMRLKRHGLKTIFGGPAASGKDAITGPGEDALLSFIENRHINTGIDELPFPIFRDDDIRISQVPWMLPIMSSRGCVNSCKFCNERKFWKGFQQRSAENVLHEIRHQKHMHGISCFRFNDSLINGSDSWIEEFCSLIEYERIDIKWGGNACIRDMQPELIHKMHSAGCRFLTLGAESGSDKILRKMNKKIDRALIEKFIDTASAIGIWVHLYLIAGHPDETEEDFDMTIDMVESNMKNINSMWLEPYDGLPGFEKRISRFCRKFKYLKGFPYHYLLDDKDYPHISLKTV